MAIPQNKQALAEAIQSSYQALQKEFATIPLADTKEQTLTGHAQNTWASVCDLAAYLLGWGELVLKWHHKKQYNEAVDFPETGYKWNELGLLAQKFYADYADQTLPELLAQLDVVVQKILLLIERTTEEDLYEKAWYKQWTLGRMIQLNTAAPYKNVRTRLRKWKKQKNTQSKIQGLG